MKKINITQDLNKNAIKNKLIIKKIMMILWKKILKKII